MKSNAVIVIVLLLFAAGVYTLVLTKSDLSDRASGQQKKSGSYEMEHQNPLASFHAIKDFSRQL